MAAEEWYTPAAQEVPVAEQPRARAAAFELRPLSLGEVLDRSFSVYRSRFWLFVGIGSVSAALQAVLNGIQLFPLHMMPKLGQPQTQLNQPFGMTPAAFGAMSLGMFAGMFVIGVLFLLSFVITQAATVFALGEVYLGRETTIADSVRATWSKWYRYAGIGIWQTWSGLWIVVVACSAGGLMMLGGTALKALGIFLLFVGIVGGFPAGIIFWLRNSLAIQATVIEQLPVRESMRRTKVLSNGAKGRVFVVLLLAAALDYAVAFLQMPLLFFVMFTIMRGGKAVVSEIAMLVVTFVGRALVEPVLMIGLSLIYFDQRVRLEALDIQILLGEENAILADASMAAAPSGTAFAATTVVAAAAAPAAEEARATPLTQSFVAESAATVEPTVAEALSAETPVVAEEIETGRADDETLP